MEAIRPIGSEDNRPDLRSQMQVELTQGLGLNQKKSQPLAPVAQLPRGPIASEDPDAVQPISAEDLDATVRKLSDYVQSVERSLRFSVDEDSGRTVVKVMDIETDEVIRQIPAEEALRLVRHIAASSEDGAKSSQGFFVREQA